MIDFYILTGYALFVFFALIRYYKGGQIILGGEGNNVLDYDVFLKNNTPAWTNIYGKGIPNYFMIIGIWPRLLWIIQKITKNIRFVNFLSVFTIYYLPFASFYLLSRVLGVCPLSSAIVAAFYCLNPFSQEYLSALLGSQLSLSIMPLFLTIIILFHGSPLLLFLCFGIASALFSLAYGNPPTFIIILTSCIFSVFFCGKDILSTLTIIVLAFLLFNASWLLNSIYLFKQINGLWTSKAARGFLDVSNKYNDNKIARDIFIFKTGSGHDINNNFLARWFNVAFSSWILTIPAIIILINIQALWGLCLVLLVLFFLVNGGAKPFGFIFEWLFEVVPHFNIFKSPSEKFGILFLFVFSIALLFSIKATPFMIAPLVLYLVFCSVPFILGRIMPEYKTSTNLLVPRNYKDKTEYIQLRDLFNNDRGDYSILVFPGGQNYQVCFKMDNGKYYTGMDPIFMNINKSFITPHQIVNFYLDIMKKDYRAYLALYGVKYIVVNDDYVDWFGKVEEETKDRLKQLFSCFPSRQFGNITVFENPKYMPKIYTSKFECSYEKIDNARYEVTIKGADKPFGLVFGENYNNLWRATSDDADINNHQKVQVFANGWEVEPYDEDDIHITIEYAPQRLFNIGLIITVSTLLITLAFILKGVLRG